MARRVVDRTIDSREARRKLKARGKPYWRAIGRGLHVGYRKGKTSGVWVIRRYLGQQTYQLETIAEADDVQDANGLEILNFLASPRGRKTSATEEGHLHRQTRG